MILGAVLAGGRSTRFGSDKAQALWRGVPLIGHVAARLATIASRVVICGGDCDRLPSLFDRPTTGLGPLAGLNAALHYAAAQGFARVVTAPCDTPVLDDRLLAALAAADGQAFLAGLPVIGSWRSDDAARLDEHLRDCADRSMRRWAKLAGARSLDLPAPANINLAADLQLLDLTRSAAAGRDACPA